MRLTFCVVRDFLLILRVIKQIDMLMRYYTVFALMAAIALGGQAHNNDQLSEINDQVFPNDILSTINDQVFERIGNFSHRLRAAVENPRPIMMRSEGLSSRMKAATVKTYGWWRENWTPEDTYSYTYDAAGNVTVELIKDAEGDYARTVNEYDANGMISFKETKTSSDGVNYDNNLKTEFEYDPILTDVITKRTEWMWMPDKSQNYDWQLVGNNYKRIIARDEKGNITSVTIAVLYDGIYDPTQRLTITYGDNGEAIEMAEQILDYNGKEYFWEDGAKVTDIVWERTDGQLYDIEDIFGGANRVKSCRMVEADGMEMLVEVEYPDPDSDAFTGKILMTVEGMTVSGTISFTPLDNDGGIMTQEITYMGMTLMSVKEELRYDEWGLMTSQSVTEEGYGESYSEGTLGEVEYDAEGKPVVYTVSQFYTDEDTGEIVSEYVIRAEYSDYVDVTADVLPVRLFKNDARCYDLQGRPVSTNEKGIIIIKDGKKIKY